MSRGHCKKVAIDAWGAEAEVLEPKSLRRELQETAERLLTLYGKMKYGGDEIRG